MQVVVLAELHVGQPRTALLMPLSAKLKRPKLQPHIYFATPQTPDNIDERTGTRRHEPHPRDQPHRDSTRKDRLPLSNQLAWRSRLRDAAATRQHLRRQSPRPSALCDDPRMTVRGPRRVTTSWPREAPDCLRLLSCPNLASCWDFLDTTTAATSHSTSPSSLLDFDL